MTSARAAARAARRLANGRVGLALHALGAPNGADAAPPLLLLHALGGSGRDWHLAAAAWPGPVHALDFSGHGESDWIAGGGYAPEVFAGDADLALDAIDDDGRGVCVAGRGVGAYVALLVAGARPVRVAAGLLLDGPGGDGGGAAPDYSTAPERVPIVAANGADAFDPLVASCALDLRPTDYAEAFARAARRLLVGARETPAPPWLGAVEQYGRVEPAPAEPADALRALARRLDRA